LASELVLGLFYGWEINPVQFVDTTPASMRADYRADYVLMIAEAFHTDQNADVAIRRLAVLEAVHRRNLPRRHSRPDKPSATLPRNISMLQELTAALQALPTCPFADGYNSNQTAAPKDSAQGESTP